MKDINKSHMCKIAKKEMPSKDPETYIELVSNPKFFCTKCGRVSSKKGMLCKPTKIGKEKD